MKKKKVKLLGTDGHTGRGFELVRFEDEYGLKCSLQESSRAICEGDKGNLGWLWLGIDDASPEIMKSDALRRGMQLPPGEVSGWMPYPIPKEVLLHTRMHLNEKQVRGLVARLQLWLDTGRILPE